MIEVKGKTARQVEEQVMKDMDVLICPMVMECLAYAANQKLSTEVMLWLMVYGLVKREKQLKESLIEEITKRGKMMEQERNRKKPS